MSCGVRAGIVALGVVALMTAASGGRVAAQSSALPNLHPNPDPASPAAEGVVIDAAGNVYTAGNDEPVAKHVPIEG